MSLQFVLRSVNGTTGSAILCKRLTSSLYTVNNNFSTSATPNAKAQKGEQLSPFWKKNVELKRPVSPHLQVYAPQLTSMLSITNRITGIATGVGITAFSSFMLFSSSPFAVHLHNLKCLGLPHWFHMTTKFLIAWVFSYHTLCGIRHLVWDTKNLLTLDKIYTTGYVMAACSVVMAIALTLL